MFGWFKSSDSTEASWNATTMTMEQPSHAEVMSSNVVTQQPVRNPHNDKSQQKILILSLDPRVDEDGAPRRGALL